VITAREGVEAFLIVAIAAAYLRKTGRARLVPAVRWGVAASIALSVAAGFLFARAANQALWEGALGAAAAVLVASLTVYMLRAGKRMRSEIEAGVERGLGSGGAGALGVFLFTVFMMTREGMETALLFASILFQVRSAEAAWGAALGLLAAAAVALLWSRHGHRVQLGRFLQVTGLFLLVFVLQLAIYSFHELTEAGVLPNSEALHLASEPYGPDGIYGRWLSYLLVALPLGWLAVSSLAARRGAAPGAPGGG